ncbi:CU044_5270 family protein [Polymorphospora rubra]|uniref:CU044_5270 family protein n=1 Tax=Polymorphospora rubra TaxID=338584 RepID=UPI00340DCBCC
MRRSQGRAAAHRPAATRRGRRRPPKPSHGATTSSTNPDPPTNHEGPAMARPGTPPRQRTLPFMAAATATVLILATTTACTSSAAAPPATPATSTPASTPAPEPTTAREHLLAHADQITAVPADAHPGPYTHTHIQLWARATRSVIPFDIRTWRHPDGSATVHERRLPDRPGLTVMPDGSDRDNLAAAPARIDTRPAGTVRPAVAEPIATDPAGLLRQLHTISPARGGPTRLLTAVGDLARDHYLDHPQRVALLHVLADIPGIEYQSAVTDIAGRTGIRVQVSDSDGTTALIIDPRTGELLALTETVTTNPPGLWQYLLIVARDRVDRIPD